MNGQQQQVQIPANTPMTVTFEVQHWNNLINALADAPYKIAAPLIQQITQQLQEQAEKLPQTPANGYDATGVTPN